MRDNDKYQQLLLQLAVIVDEDEIDKAYQEGWSTEDIKKYMAKKLAAIRIQPNRFIKDVEIVQLAN